MKRWIVNAAERTVRQQVYGLNTHKPEQPGTGEFIYDAPTYVDAMAAGARRRLAEEALESVPNKPWISRVFTIIGDRIEPQSERTLDAYEQGNELLDILLPNGFDVWREGTGLVVLGRLK
jgi:hypothetical protein